MTCVRDARSTGGGIASVAVPLNRTIRDLGNEAQLVCGYSGSDISPEYLDVTPSGRGFKKIPRRATGVVHVHGLWTLFEARACGYAHKNKLPLVISPHGMLEPWAMNHKRWKKRTAWMLYQKRMLERSDVLVVNSRREYQSVRGMGIECPVAIIENGVDISFFVEPDKRQARDNIVLFLSRLSPVKGIPDLITAWAALPAGHGFKLKLFGHADRGYEELVRRQIQNLEVGHSVEICGPIFGAEKWRVYEGAKIFVLPSFSENFGIVVAEALLAGLPVITTHATPWQCLEQNLIGWQVHNDPRELSYALWRAMQLTDTQLQGIGSRASSYARDHFLWPEIARKYLATYEWVMGRNPEKPSWVKSD